MTIAPEAEIAAVRAAQRAEDDAAEQNIACRFPGYTLGPLKVEYPEERYRDIVRPDGTVLGCTFWSSDGRWLSVTSNPYRSDLSPDCGYFSASSRSGAATQLLGVVADNPLLPYTIEQGFDRLDDPYQIVADGEIVGTIYRSASQDGVWAAHALPFGVFDHNTHRWGATKEQAAARFWVLREQLIAEQSTDSDWGAIEWSISSTSQLRTITAAPEKVKISRSDLDAADGLFVCVHGGWVTFTASNGRWDYRPAGEESGFVYLLLEDVEEYEC